MEKPNYMNFEADTVVNLENNNTNSEDFHEYMNYKPPTIIINESTPSNS